MQRICRPFILEFIYVFREILSTSMFFLLLDLPWDSPKLPWGMQRICRPFILEFIYVFREILSTSMFFLLLDLPWDSPKLPWGMQRMFWRLSLCLSGDSLSCDTHSLDLCILFILLIHSAPFLRFSHILLYTNFFLCVLPRETFFLSLMTLLLGI